VLFEEASAVSGALERCGIPLPQLVSRWLGQCFLGLLDWPDVVGVIALQLVLGPSVQAFVCASVLVSLLESGRLLSHASRNTLSELLFQSGFQEFRIENHVAHIAEWHTKYQPLIERAGQK
jgi:hypothetical protein